MPAASIGGAVYTLLALAYCAELLTQRNWLCGMLVFAATAVIVAVLWRWLRHPAHAAPRRLYLGSDGTLRIRDRDGQVVRARIQTRSMRLGRYWLLVVVTEAGRLHRLLLGPGNLRAVEQAALGRWLRRPPADPFRLR